ASSAIRSMKPDGSGWMSRLCNSSQSVQRQNVYSPFSGASGRCHTLWARFRRHASPPQRIFIMMKRSLRHRLGLTILISSAVLGLSTGAYLMGPDKNKQDEQGNNNNQGNNNQDEQKQGHVNRARIAPGQY